MHADMRCSERSGRGSDELNHCTAIQMGDVPANMDISGKSTAQEHGAAPLACARHQEHYLMASADPGKLALLPVYIAQELCG
jgi:hypothetical protein